MPSRSIHSPLSTIRYLVLPWPPSANRYWRSNYRNGVTYLSNEGKNYRKIVSKIVASSQLPKAHWRAVSILAYPPDRRKRDVDNLQKPLLDALEFAGVFEDDAQVSLLLTARMPETLGQVVVILAG